MSGWDGAALGALQPFEEVVLTVLVHQEADGAAVHAVDRYAGQHEAVQRLQHQPVAAERHDHVGFFGGDAVVAPHQRIRRTARIGGGARDEGDPLEAPRHG